MNMKKWTILALLLVASNFLFAQLYIGGNYKRFVPANDSAKYTYNTGGGFELQGGVGLGKKGFSLIATAGIDIFRINHKTNSEKKDGWLFLMGGLRKDFLIGKAKKKGYGDEKQQSFFVAANYGASASNYTARMTNDAKKSLSTKIWNAGVGLHLSGLEFAYFYQNLQDVKRGGWMPVHQFKIGILLLGN